MTFPRFLTSWLLFSSASLLPGLSTGATLYKCITNGAVTYANEPCKGQSMQVVKGNETNMVQVNGTKSSAVQDADAGDIPVVKLEPKADTQTGPAASLGLGSAAPAQAPNPGSTNERFLAQLQQQTEALAQQTQEPTANAAWPENPNLVQLPDGFEPLRMPTGEEIVAELRKSWKTELLPTLRGWLIYALGLLALASLLGGLLLYWVVRTGVKHGILAAQNSAAKRVQIPPMAQAMPEITPKA